MLCRCLVSPVSSVVTSRTLSSGGDIHVVQMFGKPCVQCSHKQGT